MNEPPSNAGQNPLRVILIDDDEEEYYLLQELVSTGKQDEARKRLDLTWVSSYEQAIQAILSCTADVFLLDYELGSRSGLDLLRSTSGRDCSAPIIMLTAHEREDIDVAAMRLGAAGYLVKDQLSLPLLERSIRYAMEHTHARSNLQHLVSERDALQQATTSLLSTMELSRLLGRILDSAQQAIPAGERAVLCVFHQPENRSSRLADVEYDDPRVCKLDGHAVAPSVLEELKHGPVLVLSEPDSNPLVRYLIQRDDERHSVSSVLAAPLMMGREVAGVLALVSSSAAAFSDAMRGPLAAFAATAAAALQNAIIYDETRELATTDALTGVLNRRALFEAGEREVQRARRFGRPVSAVLFDVDWFKSINDKYGHAAGDQVLTGIVDRCRKVTRHVDIIGRYGGDEFVILLPEADEQLAREIANRLRLAISGFSVQTNAGPVFVSLSLGVVQAREDTPDFNSLMTKADRALYESKRAGRNRATVIP